MSHAAFALHRWLPALLVTLACAVSPATAPVQAGTGVQRCRSADGETLYTDKACRAFGAQAVPVSGELANRILRERALEQALTMPASGAGSGGVADAGPYPAAIVGTSAAPGSLSRRSVAGGCARTPAQLQMDLRGAFALGDVNRIAESYHWVGASSRSAMRIMDRLGALARGQVADTQYFDAQIGGAALYADAGATMHAVGGSGGVLQVEFAGEPGGSITDFDVEHYKGCYFVRFQ